MITKPHFSLGLSWKRALSLLAAEAFLFSSISPTWADPATMLRPTQINASDAGNKVILNEIRNALQEGVPRVETGVATVLDGSMKQDLAGLHSLFGLITQGREKAIIPVQVPELYAAYQRAQAAQGTSGQGVEQWLGSLGLNQYEVANYRRLFEPASQNRLEGFFRTAILADLQSTRYVYTMVASDRRGEIATVQLPSLYGSYARVKAMQARVGQGIEKVEGWLRGLGLDDYQRTNYKNIFTDTGRELLDNFFKGEIGRDFEAVTTLHRTLVNGKAEEILPLHVPALRAAYLRLQAAQFESGQPVQAWLQDLGADPNLAKLFEEGNRKRLDSFFASSATARDGGVGKTLRAVGSVAAIGATVVAGNVALDPFLKSQNMTPAEFHQLVQDFYRRDSRILALSPGRALAVAETPLPKGTAQTQADEVLRRVFTVGGAGISISNEDMQTRVEVTRNNLIESGGKHFLPLYFPNSQDRIETVVVEVEADAYQGLMSPDIGKAYAHVARLAVVGLQRIQINTASARDGAAQSSEGVLKIFAARAIATATHWKVFPPDIENRLGELEHAEPNYVTLITNHLGPTLPAAVLQTRFAGLVHEYVGDRVRKEGVTPTADLIIGWFQDTDGLKKYLESTTARDGGSVQIASTATLEPLAASTPIQTSPITATSVTTAPATTTTAPITTIVETALPDIPTTTQILSPATFDSLQHLLDLASFEFQSLPTYDYNSLFPSDVLRDLGPITSFKPFSLVQFRTALQPFKLFAAGQFRFDAPLDPAQFKLDLTPGEYKILNSSAAGQRGLRHIQRFQDLAQKILTKVAEAPAQAGTIQVASVATPQFTTPNAGGLESPVALPEIKATRYLPEILPLDRNVSLFDRQNTLSIYNAARSDILAINGARLANDFTLRGFDVAVSQFYQAGKRAPKIYLVATPKELGKHYNDLKELELLYDSFVEVISPEQYQGVKNLISAQGGHVAEVGFGNEAAPKEGHLLSGIGLFRLGLARDEGVRKGRTPEAIKQLESMIATELYVPSGLEQTIQATYAKMV